jgi:hypothetical protein
MRNLENTTIHIYAAVASFYRVGPHFLAVRASRLDIIAHLASINGDGFRLGLGESCLPRYRRCYHL